jgi:hypothetical protein
LDTETALGVASQVELEHGAVAGVVAGDAVHRFVIAGIGGLFPQGVSEFYMSFMTPPTDICRPFLEHRQPVAAVDLVAVGAETIVGVSVTHPAARFKLVGVTLFAGPPRSAGRQIGLVGGVGIVTVETESALFEAAEVGMGGKEGFGHCFVTVETGSPGRALARVAFFAVTLGEGLVPPGAQQFLSVAAVRIVATQAIDFFQVPVEMGLPQGDTRLVASETDSG